MNAPTLPIWVEWLRALGPIAIAVAGFGLAISNFRLARQKRLDDLFNRRMDLLDSITGFQRHGGNGREGTNEWLQEFEDLMLRSEMLFGEKFRKRLEGHLNTDTHMAPFDVDPFVVRLFKDHMK